MAGRAVKNPKSRECPLLHEGGDDQCWEYKQKNNSMLAVR